MEFVESSRSSETTEQHRMVFKANSEPRTLYGSSKNRWRPNIVAVSFRRTTNAKREWLPWLTAVSVSGPNVKSDGTDGSRSHRDTWADPNGEWAPMVRYAAEQFEVKL
jgi:hypothetical protein